MPIPYYHVDVFTDALFSGNPAAVCILPAFLPEDTMQKIAAENRHSETAFVVHRSDGDFDLRWFTPEVEDDLCGHATLASAFILLLRSHGVWPVRFHTRSGVLTVAHEDGLIQMDFPAWPPEPCDPPAGLLQGLGVQDAEVMKARDYLVVVSRADQVRRLAPDISMLAQLELGIGGIIVTAPSDDEASDYVVRFFAPSVGIPEDPGTGSIQCTLAPYWAARLGKDSLSARQLSPRGAALRCQVAGDRVKIAGKARLYLQGTLEV